SLDRSRTRTAIGQFAGKGLVGPRPQIGIGMSGKQGIERDGGEGQITRQTLGHRVAAAVSFGLPASIDNGRADPFAHADVRGGASLTQLHHNVSGKISLDGYSLCHGRLLDGEEPGSALRKAALFYFSSAL